MIENLKQRVRELLEAKTVGVVLGYEQGDNPKLARPVYITTPAEADKLIWPGAEMLGLPAVEAGPILCKYLLKPEAKSYGRRGIIACPSDVRGIIGLIQEKQIDRPDVYIIAVKTGERMPEYYDEIVESNKLQVTSYKLEEIEKKIKELMALTPSERWAFWKAELSKCIKCYACRQICPLCYCRRCIADKNQPQWIPTSPHFKGDFSWNLIRAYHLAGRCIDCGECERACPVGIPLMLLNKFIYNLIKADFGYEAGFNPEAIPPLATYYQEDKENFII